MDFPIQNGDFNHVKLPEGTYKSSRKMLDLMDLPGKIIKHRGISWVCHIPDDPCMEDKYLTLGHFGGKCWYTFYTWIESMNHMGDVIQSCFLRNTVEWTCLMTKRGSHVLLRSLFVDNYGEKEGEREREREREGYRQIRTYTIIRIGICHGGIFYIWYLYIYLLHTHTCMYMCIHIGIEASQFVFKCSTPLMPSAIKITSGQKCSRSSSASWCPYCIHLHEL